MTPTTPLEQAREIESLARAMAEAAGYHPDQWNGYGFQVSRLTTLAQAALAALSRASSTPAHRYNADALYDSAYIAGAKAGYNLGLTEDNAGLQALIKARDGYLAAIALSSSAPAPAWEPIETLPFGTRVEALTASGQIIEGRTPSLSARRPGQANTVTDDAGMRHVCTGWRSLAQPAASQAPDREVERLREEQRALTSAISLCCGDSTREAIWANYRKSLSERAPASPPISTAPAPDVAGALAELADIVDGVVNDHWSTVQPLGLDSFTTQPARRALAAAQSSDMGGANG